MTLSLTILGCGSSAGVPRPALGWGACDPTNPKNRRRRCSLLAERTGDRGVTRIVIDTSPDLREQLIDANVDHIDAVIDWARSKVVERWGEPGARYQLYYHVYGRDGVMGASEPRRAAPAHELCLVVEAV